MKGKKILLIVILILVVLLAAGGAFAYFKTDLFKSNEELFYKYLLDANIKIDDKYISKVDNAKAIKTTGDLSVNLQTNSSEMAAFEAILNGAKINYEFASNNQGKNQQANVTLNFKDKEIANAKYLRNNDLYGIYLKDVLTGYLTIENNNLKQLVSKLGVTDLTNIPDKIELSTNSILNIDKETKEYIIQKYKAIIKQNISKDKYLKSDEDITISGISTKCSKYTLSLTKQEINNIIIEVLKVLKEDDRTLDFIMQKVKSIYGQILEQDINKEELKQEIQNQIDELTNEKIQNNDLISLSVYVNDKKVVKHQLKQNENEIVSIEYSNNNVQLNITVEEGQILLLINSESNKDGDVITIDGKITANGQTLPFKITETMSENSNVIVDNVTIEITMDANNTIKLISTNKIEILDNVEIESFTSTNSAKINDMTAEQIAELLEVLQKRLQVVFQNKLQELMGGTLIAE